MVSASDTIESCSDDFQFIFNLLFIGTPIKEKLLCYYEKLLMVILI